MNKPLEFPATLVLGGGSGNGHVSPPDEEGKGSTPVEREREAVAARRPAALTTAQPTMEVIHVKAGRSRREKVVLASTLLALALMVTPVSTEGLKLVAPPLGWRYSSTVTPLARWKITKNLSTATVLALALVYYVSKASETMLRRVFKMQDVFDADKDKARRWGFSWIAVAPVLVALDFAFMYLGLCKMKWGGVALSGTALLGASLFTVLFLVSALIRIGVEQQEKTAVVQTNRGSLMMLLLAICLSGASLTGCDGPVEDTGLIEDAEPVERVLMMILDTSPSFEKKNARNGEAFEFSLQVCDEMFKNSAGSNDLIVVSQISGTTRTLLFEGTPMQLRSQFPTPDAWHKHVMAMAVPGSMVNEAVRQATTHLLDMPGMRQRQVKSALIVISDMMESSGNGLQAEGAMMNGLREFAAAGGHVYVYYCDQGVLELWKNRLQQTGHSRNDVYVGERIMPPVPVFK